MCMCVYTHLQIDPVNAQLCVQINVYTCTGFSIESLTDTFCNPIREPNHIPPLDQTLVYFLLGLTSFHPLTEPRAPIMRPRYPCTFQSGDKRFSLSTRSSNFPRRSERRGKGARRRGAKVMTHTKRTFFNFFHFFFTTLFYPV